MKQLAAEGIRSDRQHQNGGTHMNVGSRFYPNRGKVSRDHLVLLQPEGCC